MADTLFAESLVPARPRAAGAGALSIGAHAVGIGVLLTVPLLAGGAPPPPAVPLFRGPVVLTVPPPPVEAPPVPRRAGPARPRGSHPAAPEAPVKPTRLVPLGDVPSVLSDDDASLCTGCSLATTASDPPLAGGADVRGGTGGGGAGGTGTAPLVVGGDVRPPLKLRHVDPGYPDLARRAGVQGAVVIECLIDAAGRVAEARIVRGVPLLDAAALAAVRQWNYRPTLLNGVAVPVLMTVTVRFQLR
jgi:periplasmic protein TonB